MVSFTIFTFGNSFPEGIYLGHKIAGVFCTNESQHKTKRQILKTLAALGLIK